MTCQKWNHAEASVTGTSHESSGTPCQDSHAVEVIALPDNSEVIVAVVSDGAGSVTHSSIGSSLLCQYFVEIVRNHFANGGKVQDLSSEFFVDFLQEFRLRLIELAEDERLQPRDFACTFLSAVVATDCACFLQLGDGAIIVSSSEEPDKYCWVLWPQQGEYANQTYFVTDFSVWDRLEPIFINSRIDEIAVFTDGIQSLALHYESRTAFAPFFRPMFQWLKTQKASNNGELNALITSYLRSERINEKSDDDKTLILAARIDD